MIYLEKGEENTFVLTLTENVSISNPTFLFKFTWEMSEDLTPVYWIGADTSIYPNRYNLFNLEEGVDATFKIGQYKYEVFESTIPNPVNETGLTKIEEGRMVVEGDSNSIYD
jgi:hypothetical protein